MDSSVGGVCANGCPLIVGDVVACPGPAATELPLTADVVPVKTVVSFTPPALNLLLLAFVDDVKLANAAAADAITLLLLFGFVGFEFTVDAVEGVPVAVTVAVATAVVVIAIIELLSKYGVAMLLQFVILLFKFVSKFVKFTVCVAISAKRTRPFSFPPDPMYLICRWVCAQKTNKMEEKIIIGIFYFIVFVVIVVAFISIFVWFEYCYIHRLGANQ